jgi:sugar phosphate isomerase/epimerase
LGGVAQVADDDRTGVAALLGHYGLKLGLENHLEQTAEAMAARLGPEGIVETVVDTGSYATHGYDPLKALQVLSGRVVHVHLRDVPGPGEEDSCSFGHGCVPLAACVKALLEAGYAGPLSIEHNPADHDPSEECRASLDLLRNWMILD